MRESRLLGSSKLAPAPRTEFFIKNRGKSVKANHKIVQVHMRYPNYIDIRSWLYMMDNFVGFAPF